jgi:AcrR family transcriptional regulator
LAVARRAPVQQRSIESMNRMLDAGEQLFYEGGSPALTLEAVIERAETSTGSFYARFGDMRGFLDAMHERVLGMVAAELLPVLGKAGAEPDLESSMHRAFSGVFEVIERHRVPLYFFAVGNAHDPEWRDMGAQFTLGMNDVFTQLVQQYLPKLTSAAGKRRVEMAVRMSMAAVWQQIMLDQAEFSRVSMSRKAIAAGYANMVCAYLRATSEK